MKQVEYRNYYRVQDGQGFVEVSFIVENNMDEVLVFQQEGLFDTMEEAAYLINYLESIGAEIEHVTSVSQTK